MQQNNMTRLTGTKEERRSYKKIFNSSSQIDEENLEREGDEPAEESVEEADEDKTDGDKEADWTEESDDPELPDVISQQKENDVTETEVVEGNEKYVL